MPYPGAGVDEIACRCNRTSGLVHRLLASERLVFVSLRRLSPLPRVGAWRPPELVWLPSREPFFVRNRRARSHPMSAAVDLRLSVGVLLLIVLGGCRREEPELPAPPPPAVTVSRPVQMEVIDYRYFPGRIEAVEMVEIRARVRGFLQAIHFEDGAEVNQGELLYEIDPRTLRAEVERAEAEVIRLQAQLQLATSEAQRAERLRQSRAMSEEEYEQRVTARETARAGLREAQAALAAARVELSFTDIYAPISGRIGRTLVTEGNLVGYAEPTLLTTIVTMTPIYVYFEVPERDFLAYQQLIRQNEAPAAREGNLPVYVSLETEEGFPHEGRIDFRESRVDPGTGTIGLRGRLPNDEGLLVPGLFARVRVPVGRPQMRLLVPEVALSADQRGTYLLVVGDDDLVQFRPVETGAVYGSLVVIEQGITPDDWVVVEGLQRARPGTRVTPETTQTPPPAELGAPPQELPGPQELPPAEATPDAEEASATDQAAGAHQATGGDGALGGGGMPLPFAPPPPPAASPPGSTAR